MDLSGGGGIAQGSRALTAGTREDRPGAQGRQVMPGRWRGSAGPVCPAGSVPIQPSPGRSTAPQGHTQPQTPVPSASLAWAASNDPPLPRLRAQNRPQTAAPRGGRLSPQVLAAEGVSGALDPSLRFHLEAQLAAGAEISHLKDERPASGHCPVLRGLMAVAVTAGGGPTWWLLLAQVTWHLCGPPRSLLCAAWLSLRRGGKGRSAKGAGR